MSRVRTHNYGGPITIFVIILVLTLTLAVLWNVVLVGDYVRLRELAQREAETSGEFHWFYIAIGSAVFVAILVLTSLLGARLFSEISWARLQSNFLASVSHEMNSPLQSIQLNVQILCQHDLPADDRDRFMNMVDEDVERLGILIGNIVRAAQIDQRRLTPAADDLMLRDYLQTFVERMGTVYERHGSRHRISLRPGSETCIQADRVLLRQILDNLVTNSIKYSGAEGARMEIAIDLEPDGPARLRFRDEGIGIPRQELSRVFGRFYRIEDEDPKRSRKGTGLGLAIVRSIAESHGWEVSISSAGPGTGTTVEITIPDHEPVEPVAA